MKYSEEFEEFFQADFTDKVNPNSNIPGIMIEAFKEVAYRSWRAGRQLGYEDGHEDGYNIRDSYE
jgi:hypothetical protein